MDKKDIELLQFIRQNAQMGTVTLSALSEMPIGSELKKVVARQLGEYRFVFDEAGSKLAEAGEDAKNVNPVTQMAATAMINLQSIADKSDSHVAEMVIVGSTRGVIAITRRIRDFAEADADCVNLAYRLLAIEKRNVEQLGSFI